jgi:negative regulator of sigma E activity
MTLHKEWTDRLSDYLDGELPADEHRAVESHLHECAPCNAVLNDLKRVVARAQAAGDAARPPRADLWAGIAERIDAPKTPAAAGPAAPLGNVTAFQGRAPRRIAFTLPQLAAAAIVVAAVSGGLAWQLGPALSGSPERLRDDRTASTATTSPTDTAASADVAQPFSAANADGTDVRIETIGLADAQYDAAVADLENALKTGRGRLDSSTIAIVEQNLQIIDQAINQARQALVGDPANTYLSSHLVETRRRKLDLLRRATALTTEMN